MSKVFVRPFYQLRNLIGASELELDAGSIQDMMQNLVKKYGKHFHEIIYDERGRLRNYTYVYVNNKPKKPSTDFTTPLSDGDVIMLIPQITPNG